MADLFPDLSGAQAAIERLMGDELRVWRADVDDAVQDPVTGAVSLPDGAAKVYEGKGMFVPENRIMSAVEGAETVVILEHLVRIPLAAPAIYPGDILEVVTCSRDETVNGTLMLISRPVKTTFAVAREFKAEEAREYEQPRPGGLNLEAL